MNDVLTRRKLVPLIATTTTALLSGCGFIVGGDPDLLVANGRNEDLTVEINLVDGSGDELFSDTESIEANSEFQRDDVLPSSGTVTLSASVEDGPSDSQEFEVDEQTSVQAHIDDAGISFEKTV